MLRIRMSRQGVKKRPFYQIVVANSRKPRDGIFIEKIGFFNPLVKNLKELKINVDRIEYWLSHGAKCSKRVCTLLKYYKLIYKKEEK